MTHTFRITAALGCLLLAGCDAPPPEAYRITSPESLLLAMSDVVTIDLTKHDYSQRLNESLENPPTRAILNCSMDDASCRKAKRILAKEKIPTESTGAGTNVTLVYEHIAARDCDQRYVDNHFNHQNLNYSALGCSVSANMVQAVTDKQQFTNPSLLDYRDGGKTENAYDAYEHPQAQGGGGGGGGAQSAPTASLISGSGQ